MLTFEKFSEQFDNPMVVFYGPGHIVFDDGNVEEGFIDFCINKFERLIEHVSEERENYPVFELYTDEQVIELARKIMTYLYELYNLTEDERWLLYLPDYNPEWDDEE